jgi:hypothetical protein
MRGSAATSWARPLQGGYDPIRPALMSPAERLDEVAEILSGRAPVVYLPTAEKVRRPVLVVGCSHPAIDGGGHQSQNPPDRWRIPPRRRAG